jgi:hypothetical protein
MFGKMVIMENMSRGGRRPLELNVGQVSPNRFEAPVGKLVAYLGNLAQIIEGLPAACAAMRLPLAREYPMPLAPAREDEPLWREDMLQHSGALRSDLVGA